MRPALASAPALALALALLTLIGGCSAQVRYFGKELGPLSALQHGVRGTVYAVDSRTLYIHDFHYDGEGPAAYFYMGSSGEVRTGSGAVRLRDERGGAGPLRKYRGEHITLSLPDGKTLRDYKWFSVYCDEYEVNFGDVTIPRGVEYPRPAKVGALRGVHGVSSDSIVIVDAQTILVPNFSYDGEAPDAKFWVGRGDKPSPQGIRIPDENGKETPLRRYDKKTIVLTLPGELTVFDIGHFAVWCEAFTVNFGHVSLPRAALAAVPPSLKMLGVSPQSKLNCEVLYDDLAFEVRWAVAGDSIVLQLVAKLEDGEYMSFGISGDGAHSQMVGGDVAVAWVDKNTLKGYAVDYYLDAKSQCAGVRGSCPDERLGEKTNSIRLLNAALVNGYSIVTYQRSLRAADELDRAVLTNVSQPIIWAIGPLNSRNEVSYHSHFTKGDKFLEFGRPPVWNCPMPEGDEESSEGTHHHHDHGSHAHHDQTGHDHNRDHANDPPRTQGHVIKPNPVPTPAPVAKVTPWEIPAIQCYEPPDGVFYAQMGPTGGKQGYSAITGHVGWGISWYINGLLIPEINVVRGRKYTFVVEGGTDPNVPAKYHPFYITNDPVGGYFHKSDEEKKGVKIYAGVRTTRSGNVTPTGVGRLCNWTPDPQGPEADEYPSFGAYQRALTLVCEEGNPGVVTWVPDKNTPDTVYYQCFTHRHLGWKINVLDECDATEAAESRVVESVALPDDMQSEESVQVQTRVTPDKNFLDERRKLQKIINTKTNYDDFSSFKGDTGLTGEVYPQSEAPFGQEYELPISKGQIKEVIQAVEKLENKMKDDMKKNVSQYQVHEEVKEMFLPEQPIREEDEYFVEAGKVPDNYFLPPNQKPLTLQSVLRPNGPNKPMGNMRPPFRRPAPPEIKLRRPPPPSKYHKVNSGYPLLMPNHHNNMHGPPKKAPPPPPPKFNQNRPPPNMNRPPPTMDRPPLPVGRGTPVPPMKTMPSHHQPKPTYNQITKLLPKGPSSQMSQMNHMNQMSQMQTIIMGKPSLNQPTLPVSAQGQTLNLGQTDIIASHVVKSQIMLPGSNDAVAQHSTIQTYYNKPGQIILGKPMDNPMPLDQQMIPTKQYGIQTPSTPMPVFSHSTPSGIVQSDNNQPSQNEIKSSDFMGESTDTSSIQPAVNTGFKPDSIVVESGFKPIIREPLMAGEDRIADGYDNTGSNRREDTDVVEDYDESPQYISNNPIFPSDRLTETFEPMFIPSPEDHLLSVEDRTKEVFPKNHAKEDRPHPVYVKTESRLNALFSKNNMEKDVPADLMMEQDRVSPQYLPPESTSSKSSKYNASVKKSPTKEAATDLIMASDRISPQYLPPDPKTSKEHSQKLSSDQTFTTYDGKTVSAATLTSIADGKPAKIFSAKLPANTEQLLKSPQFGPFKGEIPPPVDEHIQTDTKNSMVTQTTLLKLVNIQKPENAKVSDLKPEASEISEVNTKDNSDEYEEVEEYEEDLEEEVEDLKKRVKRSTQATQATQFEKGEIQEVQQTNGHSKPVSQVEFETAVQTSAASNIRLYWMTHIVLLICMKLL